MVNKNKKKGFSLLEMILVIIIAGIIYRTVADNISNSLDYARKMAFLQKLENSAKLTCNAYKSDNRISRDRGEYFNEHNKSISSYHNQNYDIINPLNYEEIKNSILLKTPRGYTNGSENNIVYKYRNGECLTEVNLSKQLYNNENFLKNTFKTEVTDNGSNWLVTFVTFEGDIDNHKIKHLLNVRNNTYRDRRDTGTFNTTDLTGRDIQYMTGFVRNKTVGEGDFLNADRFNEVNENSAILDSYLTSDRERIDTDPYDLNIRKPVRFNDNSHPLAKDGISPLRDRENNLRIKSSLPNSNQNGYMAGQNDGHIPGGRGFITCKQDGECIDNTVTPTVDSVGIKLVQP